MKTSSSEQWHSFMGNAALCPLSFVTTIFDGAGRASGSMGVGFPGVWASGSWAQ
jgi:hypothetical protein